MKFFSEKKPEPPTPKSEHLKEGVKAIIACIGTPDQFEKDTKGKSLPYAMVNQSGVSNVDYYGRTDDLTNKNFKSPEKNSYVISPIDNSDKFSQEFANCTGLVVTGQDKETGEDVSFLSHQNPVYFLERSNRNNFVNDLRRRLRELKERSVRGTVDAVIVGGNYFNDDEHYRKWYLESIELLSKEISAVLGFEPVVMTGPKTTLGRDDVFYDNKNRRLYIVRPKVGDDTTKSFVPSAIQDQEKKWQQLDG